MTSLHQDGGQGPGGERSGGSEGAAVVLPPQREHGELVDGTGTIAVLMDGEQPFDRGAIEDARLGEAAVVPPGARGGAQVAAYPCRQGRREAPLPARRR